jgi:Zn-dependent protease with chaperone function
MQSDSKSARPVIVDSLIHPKEKIYFALCVVVSVIIYFVLIRVILSGAEAAGVVVFYLIAGIVGFFIFHGLILGQIRGNGIRVSDRQFPELMAMANQHSRRLGLDTTPDIYVLQAGGILNAFATRFLGRNFVVLFSDVLALATQKGEKAVSFVVGHELGHVRRKHMTRRTLVYPAMMVPFLGGAYSRACEYTCDRIGNALEPEGGVDGLLVLAAGRELYTQVNSQEYSNQRETETGFFVRFAEILSTHPNLTKRVAVLNSMRPRESSAATQLLEASVS